MLIAFVKEVITKSVFNAEELKQQTRNSFDSKLIRSKLPKCFGEKKNNQSTAMGQNQMSIDAQMGSLLNSTVQNSKG